MTLHHCENDELRDKNTDYSKNHGSIIYDLPMLDVVFLIICCK